MYPDEHDWEKKQNAQCVRSLREWEYSERKLLKLLLLGSGESGKSTLFKQLRTIYLNGFDAKERAEYTKLVYSNVYSAMTKIINYAEHEMKLQVQEDNKASRNVVIGMNHNTDCFSGDVDLKFGPEMGAHIKALWQDSTIKEAYKERNIYQLFDSCSYFMDRIDVIGTDDYVPTREDCYRTRHRTTGITSTTFEIDVDQNSAHTFEMFDVGGQTTERKKWIHCFEDVTAVLFVASLSGYNQVIHQQDEYGDPHLVNRMDESLNLFEDIVNSRWFTDTAIVLFLNKKDLFEEMLPESPLSEFFPDYDGKNEFAEATEWISNLFYMCLDQDGANTSSKNCVYSHITCATNTDNIKTIFTCVKDTIISENLKQSGLSAYN